MEKNPKNNATKQNKSNNNSQSKKPKRNRKKKNNDQSFKTGGSSIPIAKVETYVQRDPIIKQSKDGKTVTIAHTEYIDSLDAPNINFNITGRYRINAGSAKTFSWLSKIALNFETYRFRKLIFHFKTRSSTAYSGSNIMAPDYDANDGQPTAERLLVSMAGTVEDAIYKNISCRFLPERLNKAYKSHFTCSDARFATTTQDQKTLDAGQLFCACDGVSDTPWNMGKLFVEYVVDLCTPQPSDLHDDNGGFQLNRSGAGTNLQPGAVPFLNAIPDSEFKQDANEPILQNWSKVFPTSYPTNNFGKFLRDYEGIFSSYGSGTGITNISLPTVTQNGSQVPTIVQKVGAIVNAAGTNVSRTDYIKAFAGDYLAFPTVTGSTLASVAGIFGGSQNF